MTVQSSGRCPLILNYFKPKQNTYSVLLKSLFGSTYFTFVLHTCTHTHTHTHRHTHTQKTTFMNGSLLTSKSN